ncbi:MULTISPECIES: hypothetical protein [unclassified Paraflavitalea]
MFKTIRLAVAVATVVVFVSSCSRAITPFQAANGKAKCGRYVR